jgi:CRP-like cAMP-binding protein
VFKKGDEGDQFYLIQSGGVSIIDETKEGEKEVAKLGEHDYFGEIALIKNVPRAMTTRCMGDTEVLRLEKDVIFQLIEGSKLFAANINRVGETRMETVGLS